VLLTWALAIAADLVERGVGDWVTGLLAILRRALAVILVFHYVCLAWIFFRAADTEEMTAFDNALAVLRRLGEGSTDHANVLPIVTCALAVGFATHFFADGSFAWLRRRFMQMSTLTRGLLLVGVCLVLRELAHHDIVKFIYFQF
jgi:alginate O-acetyltransferase complex protein AlgI